MSINLAVMLTSKTLWAALLAVLVPAGSWMLRQIASFATWVFNAIPCYPQAFCYELMAYLYGELVCGPAAIDPAPRRDARQAGYTLVDPVTVFLTHLGEVLRKHAAPPLSCSEVERLVGTMRKSNAGLVEELVPTVLALSEVQKVLQSLLEAKVSIRNQALILEILADSARQARDASELTELVRQRLGASICQALLGNGKVLAVLTLDPSIEQSIAASLRSVNENATLVLEPRYAEQALARTAASVAGMVKSNLMPVLICGPQLRRHLRMLTERVLPQLSIVSMAEVPPHLALRAIGMVTL